MSGIYIRSVQGIGEVSMGGSKMLGNPHVWDGFVWPSHEVDGESFDLALLCQINCADICEYDREGLLPRYGVLYFFYDLDGMPEDGGGCVLYYDGYLLDLHKMVLTDEFGQEMTLPEHKLVFCDKPAAEMPCHKLLGEDADCNGKRLLLSIDSFETDESNVYFGKNCALNFYIDTKSLKERDFSDVYIKCIKK